MERNAIYINCTELMEGFGDSVVGLNELQALKEVSDVKLVLDINKLRPEIYKQPYSVFLQDYFANALIKKSDFNYQLCQIYGNPYAITVENLQRQGCKVVCTYLAHDTKLSIEEHEKLASIGSYPFWHVQDPFGFKLYTEHVRLADLVITPSTHSKNVIMKEIGIPESKIRLVPHGIHYPSDAEVKPLPDKFSVGFLSQAGCDKGLLYLIQAWAELGYEDVELVLAGSGTDGLEPLIKQIASKGRFRLLGRVPNVADVYNNCSVFVLPSQEGFGIPLVEAMSYGRPVITTNTCGASDAVTDGINGFVVNYRDPHAIAEKIAFFRDCPEAARRMGANAGVKAKEYSWDKIRERYVDVYREVLGEGK